MTGRNRLADEKSPYLLQHAMNPVDWYPWGEEAFERAMRENRPIFLSVGYSTCHWCHVMERESFEDAEVAAFMNAHFINVKVDREEHPDVDQIYMTAVQRMTGQGGWPMSVFMTPELEPFYAGTYFPPRSRWGRPGFLDLLQALRDAWKEDPAKLRAQGRQVRQVIGQRPETELPEGLPSRTAIRAAITSMRQSFDAEWGGFGGAPKFPRSMSLQLLMREVTRRGDGGGDLMPMVQTTLEMMWRGGMYDHVGGGFARYSTDVAWLVPHFEKMLYDNALLVRAYAEAYQIDGNENWRRVVQETLHWVEREMRHEGGGFYSAQDADSEGEEGLFYLWEADQLEEILGADDAAFAARVFAVDKGANFEGKSILYLETSLEEQAEALGIDGADLRRRIDGIRARLYEAREERIHPGLDDKVLTSWNGLMIGALAFASSVFREPRYLELAEQAADFVLSELRTDGQLLRRWRDGEAALEGSLEDHAFLAHGLLELFQSGGDPRHLELARSITERALELFEDEEQGAFYFTERDRPHLIVRMKEPYDGATPSGNSVMILNLLALADLCDREDFRESAERALRASAAEMTRHPMAYPLLLCALDDAHEGPEEAVAYIPEDGNRALLDLWRNRHRPGAVTIPLRASTQDKLRGLVPLLEGKDAAPGQPRFWHCRAGVCELPVTSPEELSATLDRRAEP